MASRKLFLLILATAVTLTLGSFLLPARYEFSRALTIRAPIGVIFQHVNHLPLNSKWSPWQDDDPGIRYTFSTQKEGEGASLMWTSHELGDGRLTITKSVAPYRIECDLDFKDQGSAKAWWTFEEVAEGQGVLVTWTLSGEAGYNPVARLLGPFMEYLAGEDFEEGLRNLKKVCEGNT